MKKLEKLSSKKIEQIAAVKGGAGIYIDFGISDGQDTTTHKPSKKRLEEHYSCDHDYPALGL